jgi:hypothetical protein
VFLFFTKHSAAKHTAFASAVNSAAATDAAALGHISALNAGMEIFPSTGITSSKFLSSGGMLKY